MFKTEEELDKEEYELYQKLKYYQDTMNLAIEQIPNIQNKIMYIKRSKEQLKLNMDILTNTYEDISED